MACEPICSIQKIHNLFNLLSIMLVGCPLLAVQRLLPNNYVRPVSVRIARSIYFQEGTRSSTSGLPQFFL